TRKSSQNFSAETVEVFEVRSGGREDDAVVYFAILVNENVTKPPHLLQNRRYVGREDPRSFEFDDQIVFLRWETQTHSHHQQVADVNDRLDSDLEQPFAGALLLGA